MATHRINLSREKVDQAVENLRNFENAAVSGTLTEYSHLGFLYHLLNDLDLEVERNMF